jgi:hypothetical protein
MKNAVGHDELWQFWEAIFIAMKRIWRGGAMSFSRFEGKIGVKYLAKDDNGRVLFDRIFFQPPPCTYLSCSGKYFLRNVE